MAIAPKWDGSNRHIAISISKHKKEEHLFNVALVLNLVLVLGYYSSEILSGGERGVVEEM